MTEAPVGEVEVTREHRAIAFPFWNMGAKPSQVEGGERYIETGAGGDSAFRFSEQIAQAIATAEARGRAQACCQRDPLRIAELEAELVALKSQANEYGPAPRVNLAELAGDLETVRGYCASGVNLMSGQRSLAALDRIEAALGLKG